MNKVQENIFTTIKLVVGLIGLLLLLGLFVQSSRGIPSHAILYVDDHKKIYFAPPCLESNIGYRLTTVKEVRELGYSPDKDCRDGVGFHQPDRSITGYLFQNIGLLKSIPSRWNEDGTWNY
jgi:hypothetical protein